MRVRNVAVIGIVVGLSVSTFAQAHRRDGQWDVTTEIQMPNMPMKMPPVQSKQCITPEEAADPQSTIPSDPKSKCVMSNYQLVDENKATWNVKCENPPGAGTGVVTYGAGTFDGAMTIKTMSDNQEYTMVMKFTGVRKGDCVK